MNGANILLSIVAFYQHLLLSVQNIAMNSISTYNKITNHAR